MAKAKKKQKPNLTHELFAIHLKELGLVFHREVRVCDERKWMWDFLVTRFSGENLAIEIMGGIYVRGGHNRGEQYQSDCEKANEGVAQGLRVLRFTSEDVLTGKAKQFIKNRIL